MKRAIKILCVIPTLGHGGAQKIMVDIANHLSSLDGARDGFSVSVLTFKNNRENFYTVNDRVDLQCIDVISGDTTSVMSMIKAPLKLRQHVKSLRPDIILSFQDIANYIALVGTLGISVDVVVSERQDTNYYRLPKIRKSARSVLYRLAKKIIVQTSTIAKQFPTHLSDRIVVIPNHVETDGAKSSTNLKGPDGFYRAIAVGRLVEQKNFDLIVEAAQYLKQYRHEWKIDIYGAGKDHLFLEEKITSYGLTDFVSLVGPSREIESIMSNAHLFLFPSRYEGFPNALAEAVAAGLPSIAFEDVSGVSDLITDNVNGLLLRCSKDDAYEFSKKIEILINDPTLREKYSGNALDMIRQYSEANLLGKWVEVFEGVVK